MDKTRNERISIIDKSTDLLRQSVEALSSALALYLTLWFTERLITKDGLIDDSVDNYDTVNKLHIAKAGFFDASIVPFLASIGLVLFKITEVNKKYFNKAEEEAVLPLPSGNKPVPTLKKIDITDCLSGVQDETRAAFGFGITDKHVEIDPNGWLANVGDLKTAYDKVRDTAMKAVANKTPLVDFLKILKTEIIGDNDFNGAVKNHFKTIIWDVFAEFDRHVGYKSAVCLGYRAAIYEGGLIDHSRDFCIERNGKVFTFDEIKKFGTPDDQFDGYSNKADGMFDGKPKFDYDPFLDQGGYNCRHSFSYIPDRLAIRLRPELKEVWNA